MQIAILLALATLTVAGPTLVSYAQPNVLTKTVAVQAEPVDLNPKYDYSYSVHDGITGDQKTHVESRDGETVQGEYSLVDPDGTLRTVRYIANRDGFNAVVSRNEGYAAPAPVIVRKAAPVAAPAFYNAGPSYPLVQRPAVYKSAVQAPLVYAAAPVQRPVAYKVASQVPFGYKTFTQPKVFAQYPAQHNFITSPVVSVQPKPQLIFQQQHQIVQQPIQQQPIQEQPIQQQPIQEQPIQQQPIQQQPIQPQPIQQQPIQQQPIQQQPIQQQPIQPQPQPIQQRPVQPQPQPQPIPQQPIQQQPSQQQEQVQADDSDAVVVEAASTRRANSPSTNTATNNSQDNGSSFTYSSKGKQYDFNVNY